MLITYYKIIIIILILVVFSPVFVLGSDSPKDLIEKKCSNCHPTSLVYDAKKSRDGWENTMDRMIAYGTVLNKEERETIIQYLLKRK